MKRLNIPLIPVITGSLALIAVIAVIIIVAGAGGSAGLYITEASGTVSITNSDNGDVDASTEDNLSQGDIITVGDDSYCRIVYKSKKNSENNYMIVGANSQLVITDKMDGKKGGEIYLNRGSVLCSFSESDKAPIYIRTADSMIYPSGTVTKIEYSTDAFESYTDVFTFMGNASIQLYDAQGSTVNDPEFLVEKRTGRITTNDLGPVFSYLNIEFPLSDITARDLKNLITIANLIEDFPYTVEELKAAYDAAPDSEFSEDGEASSSADASDVIQTAEPIETTEIPETTTEAPPATTAAPITTTAHAAATVQTTTAAATTTTSKTTTTAATTDSDTNKTLTVVINVDGDETIQEVEYGGNADKPDDPVVSGKTFIGWDKSFNNITEDTVITALFEDAAVVYHTVTIVIADKQTSIQVEHGQAAPLPSTLNIEGYIFNGWDTDYSSITSDVTITAILEKESTTVTVTFMISGLPYVQTIEKGGTAIPPFVPTTDINGNEFTGWDTSLTNITTDTTITALFGQKEYTVTFVIDGIEYPTTVASGENAVPPYTPTYDSQGRSFIGWDGNLYVITSDRTITAIFI